jgi:hypothetical protein
VSKLIKENRKAKMRSDVPYNFFFVEIFFLVAFLIFSAQAEPLPSKEQPKEWAHEFTAGLESFQYKYNERTEEHKNFMQDKGMLYGVNGAYQLTYRGIVFIRPEARWAYGYADYNNWRGNQYNKSHIPSMIFEPRLLVGGNIPTNSSLILSPYTGVGFRYKWDDTTDVKNQANIPGYERVNKLWYLPVGTRLQYRFTDRWFMQGTAEYDWMIEGKQFGYSSKHFSPSPVVVKQKSGWGAKGELLVGHHFDKVSVAFGPYLQYWKIKKSSTKICTYYNDRGDDYPNTPISEPENETRELGVKLNFIF